MQKMMKIAVVMAKAAGILLYRAAQRPEIAHGSTPGARKCLPEESRDSTPRLARCRDLRLQIPRGIGFPIAPALLRRRGDRPAGLAWVSRETRSPCSRARRP